MIARACCDHALLFTQLISALISAPTLTGPDPNLDYIMETDASNFAMGAVLYQDKGQGLGLQPIAYDSKNFSGAERNYTVHEREALAIVHAFKIWRHYLEGAKTIVRTDHKALEHLKTQPKLSPRGWRHRQSLITTSCTRRVTITKPPTLSVVAQTWRWTPTRRFPVYSRRIL